MPRSTSAANGVGKRGQRNGAARARSRSRSKPSAKPRAAPNTPPLRVLASAALIGAVMCTVLVGWLPPWLAIGGLLLSTLSFGLYWHDKRAAIGQRQRIPERTLQLLALAGGWPGALLAQHWLHHKTRKARFQAVFWSCVACNIALLYALLRRH